MLVDERPLFTTEFALANLPAAFGEERLDASAHVVLFAFDVDRCVQRDLVDLPRAAAPAVAPG